jgi:alkane 1-monooxygenase
MKIRQLKYLFVFTVPVSALISFNAGAGAVDPGADALGSSVLWAYAPLIYAFAIIPVFELLVPFFGRNLTDSEAQLARRDVFYDTLLLILVPVQFGLLWMFLNSLEGVQVGSALWWGRVSGMGVMCVTIGINVGHELGHRPQRSLRLAAQALLASSLYLHFFIEHNRGHHRDVGTHNDAGTARKWEVLYLFWLRALPSVWRGAWRLEAKRLRRAGRSPWSWSNQMLQFQAVHILLVLFVLAAFGLEALLSFVVAALIGILLLETVNYIEHYGLMRKKVSEHRYEPVKPEHSWNSNHLMGRLLLFELSRHSDHHHCPEKPYPTLSHKDDAPQMPTGYPGMMMLSLIPPLWFFVMHRALKRLGRML